MHVAQNHPRTIERVSSQFTRQLLTPSICNEPLCGYVVMGQEVWDPYQWERKAYGEINLIHLGILDLYKIPRESFIFIIGHWLDTDATMDHNEFPLCYEIGFMDHHVAMLVELHNLPVPQETTQNTFKFAIFLSPAPFGRIHVHCVGRVTNHFP